MLGCFTKSWGKERPDWAKQCFALDASRQHSVYSCVSMRRINFTLDDDIVSLLGSLADQFYGGNRSLAIRAAVESLAAHSGHAGWVISGFTPVQLEAEAKCHCCAAKFHPGETLFRPVFERGVSPTAFKELPTTAWLDCSACAKGHL